MGADLEDGTMSTRYSLDTIDIRFLEHPNNTIGYLILPTHNVRPQPTAFSWYLTLVVHTQNGALNAIANGAIVTVMDKFREFEIPENWWLKILKKVRKGRGGHGMGIHT